MNQMSLKQRWEWLKSDIASACEEADRSPEEVTVVAVTKYTNLDMMREAYDLGIKHFGESRLQNALPKIESLPDDIIWHFIGPLQSNKAKKIAESFTWVHSLDSLNSAKELHKSGRMCQCCVQVNLTRELQKSGIFPEALDELLEKVIEWPQVQVRGLMTIGREDAGAEETRIVFRELRTLAYARKLDVLSMGMSGDYRLAIREGATFIRVGSLLFNP